MMRGTIFILLVSGLAIGCNYTKEKDPPPPSLEREDPIKGRSQGTKLPLFSRIKHPGLPFAQASEEKGRGRKGLKSDTHGRRLQPHPLKRLSSSQGRRRRPAGHTQQADRAGALDRLTR